MNAETSLARDLEAAKLEDAVARASDWVRVGRPIIKAYLAIDDAPHGHLLHAIVNDPGFRAKTVPYEIRTWREAKAHVEEARDNLFAMLGGIRDDFLCDELHGSPSSDATEAEWDAWEAFEEAVRREVLSVDAAIDAVAESVAEQVMS